ncbi:hypothetical protein IU474_01585 [Nocardia otitidiscaviarum]|uniref:hypothetical protein n=1 Tax=Nocardia otitidiscaviarum TaxID=1823 RepID=UPI001892DDC8|nr:hypothetical protein [Nocardia otitidiscaviarum]MBF6235773.1 hypothetical protein [Nocardia otitidiscaviarum]
MVAETLYPIYECRVDPGPLPANTRNSAAVARLLERIHGDCVTAWCRPKQRAREALDPLVMPMPEWRCPIPAAEIEAAVAAVDTARTALKAAEAAHRGRPSTRAEALADAARALDAAKGRRCDLLRRALPEDSIIPIRVVRQFRASEEHVSALVREVMREMQGRLIGGEPSAIHRDTVGPMATHRGRSRVMGNGIND